MLQSGVTRVQGLPDRPVVDRAALASPLGRRRRLTSPIRTGRPGRALPVAVTGLMLIGAAMAVKHRAACLEWLDARGADLGWSIAQVDVTGHRHTSDAAILDTLDLANARTLLRFDSAAARERIEQLPWIETAAIQRVFPDRLSISVTERAPIARWKRGDREVLIDKTGRALTATRAGSVPHLPLVTGEEAASTAAELLAVIEAFPALHQRLQFAERVDGRRWLLRLEGGPLVQLPTDGVPDAVARLMTSGWERWSEAETAVVDLRVVDHMVTRRERAPASGRARRSD